MAVGAAIRLGKLPKLDGSIMCADCGVPACQYDHRDYSKPLEVDPVCQSCNRKRGPANDWPPPNHGKWIRFELPDEVHLQLKILAARRGVTLESLIVEQLSRK